MTGPEALSPAKRALLERALRERRAAPVPAITRRAQAGPAPLSFAQQRMWFLAQWEPQAPTFNGARAFRLRGDLDAGALTDALRTVVARHEALRTRVLPGPPPAQVALDDWSLDVALVSLREHPPEVREAELTAALRARSREPFDLTGDLLLRATLFALEENEHVLLLCMHHIAADAHSDSILFAELAELYNARRRGTSARLPELPIQYADFAVWQREQLSGAALAELVAYWTAQLQGAPTLLALPTDRPRPPVQRHDGVHLPVALPRALVAPLIELGRGERVTFFMTMLGIFSTLLYRISGESDIVIGSPIANRNNLELQGLIGFFTNTMALRTRLSGNPSFREVLARTRETALGAYAHQDMPFEKVVEAVAPKRDPSHNPLFVVNFRAQAQTRPALVLDALSAEPITVDIGFSRFDLALELELEPERLSGYVEYNRDLFDHATIVALVQDLQALLAGAGAAPDTPVLELRLPHGRRLGARASGATIARRRAR